MEIIVVNDIPSDDLSVELPTNIIYLVNEKGGVAASRNMGAEKAIFPNLLFIDDDMLVTEQAVIRAHEFLEDRSNAILNLNWVYPDELIRSCEQTKFGRFLINADQTCLKGWMGNTDWKEKQLLQLDSMASPFLAISKENFAKTGGYNELFPFAGFEDYDFSNRIVEQGIEIWLDTNFTVFHNEEENTIRRNWLNRRYKNSYTRGIGVSKLGNTEMAIEYNALKKSLFHLIYATRSLYAIPLFLIPNHRSFDGLYALFLRPLIGANLMAGYYKGTKSD